jgi:hypothetical protein
MRRDDDANKGALAQAARAAANREAEKDQGTRGRKVEEEANRLILNAGIVVAS